MFEAQWLEIDQVIQIRDKALENAIYRCKKVYAPLGDDFSRALFFTHMQIWGVGPSVAADRLTRIAYEPILTTWQWSENLSGILLKRHEKEFVPLLLQTPAIAKKLTEPGDLWIDFVELRKTLNNAQSN